MSDYRLISKLEAELDIETAYQWYENEQNGLGLEFLDELRVTYNRITDGPLKYQYLDAGIRRALLRRFPYAVYFVIENVVAVLHVSRNPAKWQHRKY